MKRTLILKQIAATDLKLLIFNGFNFWPSKTFFSFSTLLAQTLCFRFSHFLLGSRSLGLLSTGRNILTIYYVLGIRESGPIGRIAQTYFSPGLIQQNQNQNQNHIIYPYLYVVYSNYKIIPLIFCWLLMLLYKWFSIYNNNNKNTI